MDIDGVLAKMEAAQAKSLENTQKIKDSENQFDLEMQGLKIGANANKAVNDAMKATANNVAQMGRPQ